MPAGDNDEAIRHKVIRGVVFLSFIASINQFIIAPALPILATELGDPEQLPWIVTTYLLAASVVTPLYGRLSDIAGRRLMITISVAIFVVGSVLCAMAHSMVALAIARAIQGIGGGGLVPLAQTAIADVVPPRDRGRYQAYFSVVYAVSSFIGPLFGGLAVEYLHWSYIFWINVPLCAIGFALSHRGLNKVEQRRVNHSLDIVGGALVTFGALPLLFALSWGGVRYPWGSWQIALLVGAAVLCSVIYILRSRKMAEPFVPLHILQDRVVALAGAGTFCILLAVVGLVTYTPLYFQSVLNLQPSSSGLSLTVMVLGSTVGGAFFGRVFGRGAWTKWMAISALAVSVVAMSVLTLFVHTMTPAIALALLALANIGLGMSYPLTNISIQNAVEHRHVGIATGAIYFIRSIAGAVSGAVLGAILISSAGIASMESAPAALKATALLNHIPAEAFTRIYAAIVLAIAAATIAFAAMDYRPLRRDV